MCLHAVDRYTPPNAVVFASGRLNVLEMVKAGASVGLAAIAVIGLAIFLLAMPILGFCWAA